MGADEQPTLPQILSPVLKTENLSDQLYKITTESIPSDTPPYPMDVVEFFREVFGVELAEFQKELLYSVLANRFTAITSCTSIGKTWMMARLVLYWLHTRPNSVVLTTGPSGDQVRNVMWRNVRTAAAEAKVPLLGESMVTRYEIAEEWYGMGFKAAKENIAAFQGFHNDHVLIIIDEATGVPDEIIDVLRAAMISEESRFVMISNPVSTSGRLYEAFHGGKGGWNSIRIGFDHTPNYSLGIEDPPIIKGMINWRWVNEAIEAYGEDSAYVQARVWGRFVSEEDVLIPLAWIDRAKLAEREDLPETSVQEAGLDVARFGKDKTVLTIRHGPRIVFIKWWEQKSTTETTRLTLKYLEEYAPRLARLKIDELGLGGGVVDQITDHVRAGRANFRVVPVSVSRKSSNPDRWRNQRQEGFNTLATLFRRGQIGIGPEDKEDPDFSWPVEADAELSDLRYTFDEGHTDPVVESKDQFRARRGRSPDFADSVMLAFFNPRPPRDEAKGFVAQGAAQVYKKVGTNWRRNTLQRR